MKGHLIVNMTLFTFTRRCTFYTSTCTRTKDVVTIYQKYVKILINK